MLDEKKWIQVTRKVIGATDERGKIETRIENVDSTKNISIVYFESIPWILRVYLHSLELTIDGKIGKIFPFPFFISFLLFLSYFFFLINY